MTKKKTLQKVSQVNPPVAENPMQAAIQSGASPVELLQFMELQERWEANEARKAYALAMSLTENEIPVVVKNAWNDQTKSNYAKEDAISKAIKPIYSKHGFSLSFDTADSPRENHIRVVCHILHSMGHKEDRHIDYPYDNAGIKGTVNKTPIHAYKSTISYARNTLTCMVFNVATGDDDDGNAAGGQVVELITEEQALTLHSKATENGVYDDFIKWLNTQKVNSIDDIRADRYEHVDNKLDVSIASRKKNAEDK